MDGVAQSLGGLTIAASDIYDGFTFDSRAERRSCLGIAAFASGPGSSRPSGQRSGPSRESSNQSIPVTGQRGQRRESTGNSNHQHGRVYGSRVTKQPGITLVKDKRPAPKQSKGTKSLPLGCPMAKGNRQHYEGVIGPCTDLKGITPTPKALMEHLKKQHSRHFRCMACWKWHKSKVDLENHQASKPGGFKCEQCCKVCKNGEDLAKHHEEVDCTLDPSSVPQMFSPDQEEAFKNMKNKSAGHGNLETKFQWVFDALFPDHHDRKNIWPFYDFTCFTHKLPMPITGEERVKWSGGIRRDQSAAMSPSDRDDEHSSPHLGADTADDSTVVAGNAYVDPNTSPTTIASQNTFRHSQGFEDSYPPFSFPPNTNSMMLESQNTFMQPQGFQYDKLPNAVPAHSGLTTSGLGHAYRATSFDSTVPALTMSTRSVPDQSNPPTTPLNENRRPPNLPLMKEEPSTQPMLMPQVMTELDMNTSMSFPGHSFGNYSMSGPPQTTDAYSHETGDATLNPQSEPSTQQTVPFNQHLLQRTPTMWDPLYYQKLAHAASFEQDQNSFFHNSMTADLPGDSGFNHLNQNLEDGNAYPPFNQPQ